MADAADVASHNTQRDLDILIMGVRNRLPKSDVVYKEDDVVPCICCGEQIPYRRLQAMPGTKHCVKCAE